VSRESKCGLPNQGQFVDCRVKGREEHHRGALPSVRESAACESPNHDPRFDNIQLHNQCSESLNELHFMLGRALLDLTSLLEEPQFRSLEPPLCLCRPPRPPPTYSPPHNRRPNPQHRNPITMSRRTKMRSTRCRHLPTAPTWAPMMALSPTRRRSGKQVYSSWSCY